MKIKMMIVNHQWRELTDTNAKGTNLNFGASIV